MPESWWYPMAVQTVAELHDTASMALVVAPAGSGVVWVLQAVPFHASAKVTSEFELLSSNPTAVQAVAEVHDTPYKALATAPLGLGVVWIPQVVPFHTSAKVSSTFELLS